MPLGSHAPCLVAQAVPLLVLDAFGRTGDEQRARRVRAAFFGRIMEGGRPARCGAAAALAGASAAGRRRRRRGRGARRAHPPLFCASRSARRSTRDATAAVAPWSTAIISGVCPALCHAAAACTRGTRYRWGWHAGGRKQKRRKGLGSQGGWPPKKRGSRGYGGSPEALILGQNRQRSRAVLGALSAGAKWERSGWGVAYPSRALMSPPFLWNSCNVPRHDRDANAAACRASRLPSERARK